MGEEGWEARAAPCEWRRQSMESSNARLRNSPALVYSAGQGVGALQLAARPVSDVAFVIRQLAHELGNLFDHVRP